MGLHAPEPAENAEISKGLLAAALIIEEGRLLLVYNIKGEEVRMEPPGGKVQTDKGETPVQAAEREPHEELGIDVEAGELLGIYETQSPEGAFDVHMYVCRKTGGEIRHDLEPGKIGGSEWFDAKELEALAKTGRMVPNLKAALPAILARLKAH